MKPLFTKLGPVQDKAIVGAAPCGRLQPAAPTKDGDFKHGNGLEFLPARWLSLALLIVYLLTYAGVTHSIDELAALTVTESLLVEQRWHTNQMAWDQARIPPQNAPGLDGNLYSKKGLGLSLLALPLFALRQLWPTVGAVQLALLLNSFLTAATAYLFYRLTVALHFSTTTAAIGALTLGLATPLWPYARTLFSESLAAFGLGVALLGAVGYRQAAPDRSAAMPLFWCSCGLALLVLARSANALLAAPFLLYIGYVSWHERVTRWPFRLRYQELFALSLPLGGAVMLTLLYNYARFHTWFTFPQAAFETFSTPFLTGLTGLLVSPGKGLLWYMPVVMLIFFGLPAWRKGGRRPEYALAAALIVSTLLLYAKWYDWTGGRAWGPRLLVMTTPALLVLCLPRLDHLRSADRFGRWWIGGVLGLSCLVQLLGVLLNFELLEAIQMQAGVSFEQLVWSLPHTPLLTYWPSFFSHTGFDPVWGRAAFWQQAWQLCGLFVVTGGLLLFLLGVGLQQARRGQATRTLWMGTLLLALLFALLTVRTAADDPRWAERTANPADNQAVVDFLQAETQRGDVVLLDMTAATDQQGRQGFWMNHGVSGVPYIAWVRNSPALAPDEQLGRWLQPYSRIWLVMQETVENAPDSTTEQWLDQHAYRGRQQWIGSQRVVEYLAASQLAPLVAVTAPTAFDNGAVLERYQVRPGNAPATTLIDLAWQTTLAAEWRFSVQALDSQGQVVAQIDDRPARLPEQRDQIGLTLPPSARQLILKLYHSQSGTVARVETASAPTEFLTLYTFP